MAKANKHQSSPQGKLTTGRDATGIKHSSRHRLGKLADKSVDEIKATASKDQWRLGFAQGKSSQPRSAPR